MQIMTDLSGLVKYKFADSEAIVRGTNYTKTSIYHICDLGTDNTILHTNVPDVDIPLDFIGNAYTHDNDAKIFTKSNFYDAIMERKALMDADINAQPQETQK